MTAPLSRDAEGGAPILNFKAPVPLRDAIRRAAAADNVSISALIRDAVQAHLATRSASSTKQPGP